MPNLKTLLNSHFGLHLVGSTTLKAKTHSHINRLVCQEGVYFYRGLSGQGSPQRIQEKTRFMTRAVFAGARIPALVTDKSGNAVITTQGDSNAGHLTAEVPLSQLGPNTARL